MLLFPISFSFTHLSSLFPYPLFFPLPCILILYIFLFHFSLSFIPSSSLFPYSLYFPLPYLLIFFYIYSSSLFSYPLYIPLPYFLILYTFLCPIFLSFIIPSSFLFPLSSLLLHYLLVPLPSLFILHLPSSLCPPSSFTTYSFVPRNLSSLPLPSLLKKVYKHPRNFT